MDTALLGRVPDNPPAILLVSLLICIILYACWPAKYPRLPPGPRGLPVLGNALQIPREHQEKVFFKWGQQYGEIVYARLFRTPAIIINSLQAARDLLEKQSANYSDRPSFTLIGDLMDMHGLLPFLPYGPRFRKARKWFYSAFHPQVAVKYQTFQRREANIVLDGLLQDPAAYSKHFTRFGAAVLMEVTYGHQVTTDNDLFVRAAHDAMSGIANAGSAGGGLVDFFPVLKYYPSWMPGGGFQTYAQKVYESGQTMRNAPYDMVKERFSSATGARPCFTSNLIEEHLCSDGGLSPQDEQDIKDAAGTFYAAGAETLDAVMNTFILAMVRHPEVFRKAREEMDRVVGSDRLPDFDDRASLPYLNCVIKEVYRWNPPGPLAIPHAATNEGEYCGYHIPAGSMVIPNIWAMCRCGDTYPLPDMFNPERFMSKFNEDLIDPKSVVFGFGRRICPGKDFADSSAYLLMSNIIATMDIAKALDRDGLEITPPLEFTSGMQSKAVQVFYYAEV
ncbi:cytochrome P450 [Cristinia sonorae]|uniref:Cytochrome P450 n=1 Tax=Cristinia sonorae TaxID=1940300 RepID=A0A8K0UJ19_9AGAR|nr:cytochrome P450 [Cristinia sonorae]